ncbi:hypothetical protein K2173_018736 [Erythroxylum novogranatense]|uniref:Uncharacterized protein n=1 Tax=Erythroxylum novogranatense TaxID=1862640 RepID=A0AAV8SAL7_9ROSI|nr:hypothetical protein K2173_018736 [Erythroxylum novogranatense]
MILQSGSGVVGACGRLMRASPIILCLPSNTKTSTDQLRLQLDQLHAEAETTREQANSGRLRLMRLSEAAEKLKGQAAISVNSGKETEARDLLFQKKKVMQAMERSKSRIALLDELSMKLNEAISMKESQLIGNVASDLEVDGESTTGPIRIISPKQGVKEDIHEEEDLSSFKGQEINISADGEASPPCNQEVKPITRGTYGEDSIVKGLNGISSYEDFLEHLDLQLSRIEAELVTILNVSSLVLSDNEKHINFNIQQTIELLESIRGIRLRVASFTERKEKII